MHARYIAEATFAAIFMAAGVALFIAAPDIVRGWAFAIPGTTDVALEPSFFPRLASGALVLSALAMLLTMRSRTDPLPLEEMVPGSLARVGFGLIGIGAYLALVNILGFVVSSSIFIIAVTWLGGYRRLVVLLPVAILSTIALRLVFRFGLHVGLPTGFFF